MTKLIFDINNNETVRENFIAISEIELTTAKARYEDMLENAEARKAHSERLDKIHNTNIASNAILLVMTLAVIYIAIKL